MSSGTLIIVPTFNEAENIPGVLAALQVALPSAHTLVVDDASADGTSRLVEQLAHTQAGLHLLRRPAKLGLGTAYVDGFRWGLERGYERFFEMDADFSHDPMRLRAFVSALDAGADVVVGSRNMPGGRVEGWGPLRHVLSKGGSLYSRLLLGVSVCDLTTGFKAYTRQALESIDIGSLRSNGYAFQIETTYRALRCGLRVVEIPIVFVDRRAGRSKMSLADVLEAVTGVIRMRLR
ncbi:MAG TPA: polyprenol monophosphomannose synthase [Polyangiaceae bacterium]|nr:polyprenol monophosphomannose synthase [Polyangiaceae bacterium]